VGEPAGAIGMLSGTTLTASIVFVPSDQRGPRTFPHQGTKPIPFAGSAHTLGDSWNGEREAGPSAVSQPSRPSHSWGGTDHGALIEHQFGHSPH
jgi:hypothetical protein